MKRYKYYDEIIGIEVSITNNIDEKISKFEKLNTFLREILLEQKNTEEKKNFKI